ncbi:MAG: hypothetical protein KC501_31190 [Myxococcales bacterium]|nr:hypothetical protein [Myxococcales bacterium]
MLGAVMLATNVHAAPLRCPSISGGNPALAALDAEARLAFIRARLRHDAHRARQWSLGFGTSYSIIAAGSLAYGTAVRDPGTKADAYTGGAGALVGLGLLVVSPLTVVRDHDMLEAHVAAAGPEIDRCRLLAIAETMLVRDAKNEAWGRGWFTHTGNALLGVATLLVLGLGFHHWSSGTINAASSIAIGELMIDLQPHGLVRDLRAYRRGDLRSPRRRRHLPARR